MAFQNSFSLFTCSFVYLATVPNVLKWTMASCILLSQSLHSWAAPQWRCDLYSNSKDFERFPRSFFHCLEKSPLVFHFWMSFFTLGTKFDKFWDYKMFSFLLQNWYKTELFKDIDCLSFFIMSDDLRTFVLAKCVWNIMLMKNGTFRLRAYKLYHKTTRRYNSNFHNHNED